MFLDSNQIKVFPLAKPRSVSSADITSRIFYEQNVSNIIRQLTSVEGFVIDGEVNTKGEVESDTLKLNIFGYYFEISKGASLVPEPTETDKNTSEIHVGIRLSNPTLVLEDQNVTIQIPIEVIGQDVNEEYQGLYIGYSLPSGYTGFHLLTSSGTGSNKKWEFAPGVKKKFDYDKDLDIKFIDGKN